jgi:hypothetical protein
MNSDWVKVYSSSKEYLVEITHGILEEEGIESVIINKIDSAYLFGESELFVRKEDALEALQIISKIETETNPESDSENDGENENE